MNTKRSTRTTVSSASDASEQLEKLAGWQGEALSATARAGQAYAQGMVALNQELAHFVQARWRHDVELGESLMRCRDWHDAAALQQEWLSEMSREYIEETRKLLELGSTIMRDSWLSGAERPVAGARAEETQRHS